VEVNSATRKEARRMRMVDLDNDGRDDSRVGGQVCGLAEQTGKKLHLRMKETARRMRRNKSLNVDTESTFP